MSISRKAKFIVAVGVTCAALSIVRDCVTGIVPRTIIAGLYFALLAAAIMYAPRTKVN